MVIAGIIGAIAGVLIGIAIGSVVLAVRSRLAVRNTSQKQ